MSIRRNLWQTFLEFIPKPFRNRYVFALTLFFLWMLFMDTANILTQFRLSQTVNKLEEDKVYYQEKIQASEEDKKDLEQNLEKFAREKYQMKKANEDVFIIEEAE